MSDPPDITGFFGQTIVRGQPDNAVAAPTDLPLEQQGTTSISQAPPSRSFSWGNAQLDAAIGNVVSGSGGDFFREQAKYQFEEQAAVEKDFEVLWTGDWDENQDWNRLANMAINASHSELPEHKDLAQQIFHQLRNEDKFKRVLEINNPGTTFEDYYEAPAEPNKLVKGFSKVMETISRPGRWGQDLVTSLIGDIREQDPRAAGHRLLGAGLDVVDTAGEISPLGLTESVIEQVTGKEFEGLNDLTDDQLDKLRDQLDLVDRSYLDVDESGEIGFREALGLDPQAGEKLLPIGKLPGLPDDWNIGLGDLVEAGGTIASDPLSYISLGAGGVGGRAARRGMDALDSFIGRASVNTALVNSPAELNRLKYISAGLKSGKSWKAMQLTPMDEKMVKTVIQTEAEVGRVALTDAGVQLSSRAQRQINRAAKQLKYRAGGGVFFAGKKIPGSRLNEQALRKGRIVGSTYETAEQLAKAADDISAPVLLNPHNALENGIKQTASSLFDRTRKAPKTIRKAINPSIQIGDKFGAYERGIVREVLSTHVSKLNSEQLALEVSLRGDARKAIEEVKNTFGRKVSKKVARQEFNDIVNRVRALDGSARSEAIEALKAAGHGKVADFIPKLDAIYAARIQKLIEIGGLTRAQAGKVLKDEDVAAIARRYTPRVVDSETDQMVRGWLEEMTPEGQYLVQNARPSDDMVDYLIKQGLMDPEDAKKGIFAIFNRWTKDSDEARKLMAKIDGEDASSLGEALTGVPATKARKLFPKIDGGHEINEAIAKAINKAVKESDAPKGFMGVTRFYSENQVDIAIRTAQGHNEAVLTFDILEELSDLAFNDLRTGQMFKPVIKGQIDSAPLETAPGMKQEFDRFVRYADNNGEEISFKLPKKADDLTPEELNEALDGMFDARYRVEPVKDKFYLVEKTVAEEIDNVKEIVKRGHLDTRFGRFINQWNAIWAAHATVPLVGTAFHARNALGNWILMAMAGVKNPGVMAQAMDLQLLNRKVQKHWKGKVFASWDDSLEDMISKNLLKSREIKQAENLLTARNNGVISSSFFNDLSTDAALFDPDAQKWIGRAKNKLTDNKLVSSGQTLGSSIENNARLSVYLDSLGRGMSPRAAAQHTKKFLFDYSDLTPFENNKMRTVSRFYTWMRKNTALQARLLASQPGSVVNAQRIVDGLMGAIWGDDGDPGDFGLFIPDWAQRNNMGFSADRMMLHGYETPLMSAVQTFEDFGALAASLPGGKYLMPEWLQQGSTTENATAALGLLASGPSTAITNYYEMASGKELFSGRAINDSEYFKFWNFIESVVPSATKFMRELERYKAFEYVGAGDWEEEHGLVTEHQEGHAGLRLLNTFLGVSVYKLNDEQQVRYLSGIVQNYEDLFQDLKKEGYENPPTRDELVQAGAVARRNEYLHALYLARDPSKNLLELVPGGDQFRADIAEELGIPFDVLTSTSKSHEEWEQDFEWAQLAWESLKQAPLSEEELLSLSLAWDNRPPNEALEEFGIGGIYEPIFPLPDKEVELAERNKKMNSWLDLVGDQYGLTPERMAELRPNLLYWDRFYVDAKEAGMSDTDIVANMTEHMGRARIAAILGPGALEEYDYEKDLDAEELEAINRGATWDIGQLDLYLRLTQGRRITDDEAKQYVLWGGQRLTKTMQGELAEAGYDLPGLAPPVPNREPYPGYSSLENAENAWTQIQGAVDAYDPRLLPEGTQPSQGQGPATSGLPRQLSRRGG